MALDGTNQSGSSIPFARAKEHGSAAQLDKEKDDVSTQPKYGSHSASPQGPRQPLVTQQVRSSSPPTPPSKYMPTQHSGPSKDSPLVRSGSRRVERVTEPGAANPGALSSQAEDHMSNKSPPSPAALLSAQRPDGEGEEAPAALQGPVISQTYLRPPEEERDEERSGEKDPPWEDDGPPNHTSRCADDSLTYGWGSFRPQCLQFLNRPIWVVVFLCVAIVAESMATVGLVSISISTLEKRFHLSSNQAGFIPSAYEFAGLPALIISGYFGGHGHRPRWIAMGMLLLSMGSLLFALPHFITGTYSYDQAFLRAGSENTCNTSSAALVEPCSAEATSEEDLVRYLYVFMAGHTLHGIGGVPLYTLSLTYIDDIAPRGTASVYIGIILSLTTLGPAIAFVGAGYLLELYTDIDVVDVSKLPLTSSDPRWVGAWWIGFLVTFSLAFVTVVPLAGFPRDLPGAAEHRKKRITEVHDNGENLSLQGVPHGVGIKSHDFPRAVSVLIRNPTFMFLTLIGAFQLFFLSGFGAFEPKYMEKMFNVSPATAGTITGLLGVPGGAAGSILASVFIKRFKMTSTQMLKCMFWLCVVIIFLNVIFLVQCDNIPFAGVNVPYNSSSRSAISLTDNCNENCACSEFSYEPVCGSNNIVYFSPCYAGCDVINGTSQYENCSCIPSVDDTPSVARLQSCTSSCYLLPVYSVLLFLGIMLAYLTAMFHLLTLIRVVPESQRSFAVSIDWFLSRLLGGILGPVVFGSMLDLTCVLWEQKCDGSGSCLYYENSYMGWYIFLMANVCLVACGLFSFLAWKKYRPPRNRENTLTNNQNEVNGSADKVIAVEMNGISSDRPV